MIDDHSKLWYLAKINLFQELSPEALKEVAQMSRMRDFERDTYISTPHDDDSERIYFLKRGEVEVYESTDNGKKIIIDILEPGDIFGYKNIADDLSPGNRKFIRANSPVTLCIMPRLDFLELLKQKPELALKIIKTFSERLSNAEGRLRDAALYDVETRVFKSLERLCEKYGIEEDGVRKITRRFTHEEVAQFVGAARETITRALSQLAKKGKISIDKSGHIIVKNK